MGNIIYITGVVSFIIQIMTIIVDTYALTINLPPSLNVIKSLLWVEYIVNFIEGTFYIWMIHNFSKIKNITKSRYYDWFITTPTMLFTYSVYLIYTKNIEEKTENDLLQIITTEKYTFLLIILLDWIMLFFGYISEIGKMNKFISTFIGFIPFVIMFYIIYNNYSKYSPIGIKTFIYFVLVWGLYGVAALMNYKIKNIMYNILDLFSKNFFGLFLAFILIQKYVYN